MNHSIKGLLVAFLISLAINLQAADRYWVASSTSNWNNTANWSTTSGGSGGASVPTSGDRVFFNSSRNGDCNIDANANVYGFSIAGYSGTITQTSTYTITVGAYDFDQSSGTFTGGSGNIDVNDAFTMTGGMFNSTSGTLYVAGDFQTYSGGTFNHNSGTVLFDASGSRSINVNSSMTFNNLNFNTSNQTMTVQSSDVLVVLGTLTLDDGYVNYISTPGYFDVRGNVSIGANFDGGSFPLKFTGSATTQTLYSYYAAGFKANITIDKSAGSVQLSSHITMSGQNQSLYLTSGTLDINAKNLIINLSSYVNTLTVNGSFTLTGSGAIIAYDYVQTTGTLSNSGSMTLRTYNDFTLSGGTFNWGSGTITVDDDFVLNAGTFNAPSSTLYITGSYSNYSTATFNHNSGTVEINGSGTEYININTSESFYNLTFNKTNATITVQSGDILVVNNTLTLTDGYVNYINTIGYMDAKGNVSIGANFDGGSEPLRFSGSAVTQTFYSYNAGGFNADITINKSSGEVKLISSITLDNDNQDLFLTSGTLNVNGYNLIIDKSASVNTLTVNGTSTIDGTAGGAIIVHDFIHTSGTLTVSGSVTLRTYDDFLLQGGTFNWGAGTVDVDDDMVLSSGTFNAPSSTLYIGGSFDNVSTATFNHNNATVLFDGSGTEYINVNVRDTFYNLTFSKYNGTITIQSADKLITKGTLTYDDGYVNATGTVQAIEAQGNVTINANFDGGSEPLHFTGGAAIQTFYSFYAGTFNGNIVINKSSGEVRLTSHITLDAQNHSFTTTSGTLNLNNYNLTVYVASYVNVWTVNGTFELSGAGNIYTYQFLQSSGTLTISGTANLTIYDDFTLNGGTFTGGSGYVNVDDDFTLSAGTFNAPSGILYVSGNFIITSATFNDGGGSVYFDGNQDTYFNVASTETFNNVRVDKSTSRSLYIYGGDVLIVDGTLTLNDGYIYTYTGTGTIRANGNVDVEANFDGGAASLVFEFAGSATQTLDLTGATNMLDADIWINKTGGELGLASNWTMDQQDQDIYFYQGTVNLNGFTLTVYNGTYATGIIYVQTGTSTIAGTGNINSYQYVQSSGTLSFSGAATYTVYDDFTMNGGTFSGSTGYLNIDDDFTINSGTYNSTSGICYIAGNFVIVSGTFNPGSGTVRFDGTQDTYANVNSTETFNNLVVDKSSSRSLYVYVGDFLIVTGTTTLNDGYIYSYNGTGYIQAQGNVDVESGFDGGSAGLIFEFTGSENQTFDLTSATNLLDADIRINKTGGQVNLASNLTMDQQDQDLYMILGTLNLNSYTLTVYNGTYATGYLYPQTTSSSIIGSGTLYAYRYSQSSGTLTMGGTVNMVFYDDFILTGGTFVGGAGYVNVDDDFDISNGTFTAPSGTLYVSGNFVQTSGTFNHNSGTVRFDGAQHTYVNVNSSITLNDLFMDKSSASYATYIYSTDVLVTIGTLTLNDGALYGYTGTGYLEAQGNVSVSSNFDGNNTTVVLRFAGSATQTFYSYYANFFNGDIHVNKTGGKVNMTSNFTLDETNQDLIIQEGEFNTNGYTLTINGSGSTFVVENGGVFARQGTETLSATPTFQTGSTMCYLGRNVVENITIVDYGATDYYNLTIYDINSNKATFVLGANLNISGVLNLASGQIDAGSYTVAHNGLTGTSGSCEVDLGTVNAPSSQNLGNLGLVLTSSANLGATTIRVFFDPITANSNQGINRYYIVTPTNNTGLSATVVFNYLDTELNGLTESTLLLYKSTSGSSWTDMSSSLNTTNNTLSVSSVDNLNWFTAGSSASPLPVSLLHFKGERVGEDVLLEWATASELNNNFFTIERSEDGENFESIATVYGAGNSQEIIKYLTMDYNVVPGNLYYRLLQTDFDGTQTAYDVIVVAGSQRPGIQKVLNNVQDNEITLVIESRESNIARLEMIDMQGRVIRTQTMTMERGLSNLTIQTGDVPTGVYIVLLEIGHQQFQHKVSVRH